MLELSPEYYKINEKSVTPNKSPHTYRIGAFNIANSVEDNKVDQYMLYKRLDYLKNVIATALPDIIAVNEGRKYTSVEYEESTKTCSYGERSIGSIFSAISDTH